MIFFSHAICLTVYYFILDFPRFHLAVFWPMLQMIFQKWVDFSKTFYYSLKIAVSAILVIFASHFSMITQCLVEHTVQQPVWYVSLHEHFCHTFLAFWGRSQRFPSNDITKLCARVTFSFWYFASACSLIFSGLLTYWKTLLTNMLRFESFFHRTKHKFA